MTDKGFRCKYAKLFNVLMIIVLIGFSLFVVYLNPNEALNFSWATYGFIFIVAAFVVSAVNYAVCFFKGRAGR